MEIYFITAYTYSHVTFSAFTIMKQYNSIPWSLILPLLQKQRANMFSRQCTTVSLHELMNISIKGSYSEPKQGDQLQTSGKVQLETSSNWLSSAISISHIQRFLKLPSLDHSRQEESSMRKQLAS